MSTHRTYAKQLEILGYGYALYEPNPMDDYDRVRVGDVGYIQKGKFMKLFNIFEPLDDAGGAINNNVPEMFEPLPEEFRLTSFLEPLSPGVYRSKSVRCIGGSLELSG